MTAQYLVWSAAGLVAVTVFSLVWLLAVPSSTVPRNRRRSGERTAVNRGSQFSERMVGLIDERVASRPFARRWAHALDRAGVRMPVSEFVVLVMVVAVAAFAAGFLLGGVLTGLLTVVLGLLGLVAVVSLRSGRRKAAFADALDDVVQHLSTNLRAGHSTVQSLETVGREIEEPTKSELLRAVNQVRIGRDLGEALLETAERMDSDDFKWVAQAITIHRQVGGNLGEVLDTVSQTMRERQQMRRQVKALSAEGRMSAWVLLALPVFIGGTSAFLNPDYTGLLWTRGIGLVMLAYGILSMIAGGIWMMKVVTVKF